MSTEMFSFKDVYDILEEQEVLVDNYTIKDYMQQYFELHAEKASEKKFTGINLDSRTIQSGEVFIPIEGEKFDGYQFAADAVCRANSFMIGEKVVNGLSIEKQIIVKSTYLALRRLAAVFGEKIQGKKIEVTGSAGKTTLKVMLGHILNEIKKPTYFSKASFNTWLYGVPISMINCPDDVFAGIFEAGMSQSGQIDRISSLLQPDIGIISSIQRAHIGNFRDEIGIVYAKGEMLFHVKELAIFPAGVYEELFRDLTKQAECKTFGKDEGDARLLSAVWNGKVNACLAMVNGNKIGFEISHPSEALIMSALACLLVCDYFKLNLAACAKALKTFQPVEGRGDIKKIRIFSKDMIVYDDSYNANLDSMIASINSFKKLNSQKTIAVLGQMNELEDFSTDMHLQLQEYLTDFDIVFLYGEKMRVLYDRCLEVGMKDVQYAENLMDIFAEIQKEAVHLPVNTGFFIKGSRDGIFLDKVVDYLVNFDGRREM